MKKAILNSLFLLVLAACSSTSVPEQTLSEKLEGKTFEERQETIWRACLNETEWSTNQKKKHYATHRSRPRVTPTQSTSELKALCREMAEINEATKKE